MNRRLRPFLLILLAACWLGQSVVALAAQARPQSIKVVMDDNYPAFVLKDSGGKLQSVRYGEPLLEEPMLHVINVAAVVFGVLVLMLFIWNRALKRAVGKRSAELRTARDYAENLIQTANVMVVGLDGAGRINVFNRTAESITGYTREELQNANWFELLTPRERYPYVWQEHQRLMTGGLPKYFENPILTKTGEERFIVWSNNEVLEGGKIVGTVSFGMDITERKAAEAALLAEKLRYRQLFDAMIDGFALHEIICDENGTPIDYRFLELNPAFERMIGLKAENLLGRTVLEVMPGTEAYWIERYGRVALTGEADSYENYAAEIGRYFEVSAYRPAEGQVACVVVDITERRQAEESLRESEERLRVIFEASDAGIILVSPRGVIDFANRRMAEMFGMSHDELIGTVYTDHLHEAEKKIGDERMRLLISGEVRAITNERHYIRKDGSDFWGYLSGRRLENPDGSLRALVGVITDIGERKQMTRLLAEKEIRLRTLVQNIPDLIWLKDADGVYLFCNTMFERLFGAREADIVGKTDYDFVDRDLADFFRAHDCKAMAAGMACRNEEWVTFSDDGHHAFLDTVKTPMYDAEGTLTGVLGVAREITDRKKAEEERLRLERQLLHAQKLESLGVLAGGIAHDFNNLLLAILGNLDLAQLRLPGESPASRNIVQAMTAARHAAELTNRMLAYSGRGAFVVETLDLNAIIEENAAMLKAAIAKTATFSLLLQHDLPPIIADAAQVQQIVMNLITNASDALGEQAGTITLATGMAEFDEQYLQRSRLDEKPSPGRFVWLEVVDTGCGMTVETNQQIFDPFFTTKFTGRGLGLSAVLGIVRGHHGALLLDSAPGAGTVIRVLFPLVTADKAALLQESAAQVMPAEVASSLGLAGFALVVDDEQFVRDVCCAMMEQLGFRVLTAVDGVDAVRIFQAQQGIINIVLLDMTMPQMGGLATFRELQRLKPDVRVILCSGFSEQEVVERLPTKGWLVSSRSPTAWRGCRGSSPGCWPDPDVAEYLFDIHLRATCSEAIEK